MADINDFKNIKKKSIKYFDFLKIDENDENEKARLGFYLFGIECVSEIADIDTIAQCVLDCKFNKKIFGKNNDDLGVDAVIIDYENNNIDLYIFKYQNEYKPKSRPGENAIALATKFFSYIKGKTKTSGKDKTEKIINEIIDLVYSSAEWNIKLNYVCNNSEGFDKEKNKMIALMEKEFGMKIQIYTLNELADFISLIPKPVNAKMLLNTDSILIYEENHLSTKKSYVLRIPVLELIKICSTNEDFRSETDRNKIIESLDKFQLNYDILFENVRGYLGETKYNKNILETLLNDPRKFFMYNNGVTATAHSIDADLKNANEKILLELNDFQVVNGGQTLKSIYKAIDIAENNDIFLEAEVLLKVFYTKGEEKLTNKIAEYTNSQNAISDINLKSLDYIQLQIENHLKMDDILYVRKAGYTGDDNKSYKIRISMEKFAQIVYSAMGHPDRASNHKRKLFSTYYNDIFGETFNIEKSKSYVKEYYDIINYYKSTNYDHFDQKYFYSIYLTSKAIPLDKSVELIEVALREYRKDEQISDARKLLQVAFKEKLDELSFK